MPNPAAPKADFNTHTTNKNNSTILSANVKKTIISAILIICNQNNKKDKIARELKQYSKQKLFLKR
jgi:hypothetical protein